MPMTHDELLKQEQDEQERYKAGVEAIRDRNLSISEAIIALANLYKNLFGKTPYQINCGDCEDFGEEIFNLFPDAVADWGDGFCNGSDDSDKYAYHYIIEYKGKYYDSEHPNGVEDFRTMSAFRSKKKILYSEPT